MICRHAIFISSQCHIFLHKLHLNFDPPRLNKMYQVKTPITFVVKKSSNVTFAVQDLPKEITFQIISIRFIRTGWFRSTLGFDLLGFRSILVSICTRYQFQTAHYSIYTNSDLHSFRSALFSLCNFWICKDFALLSIRSAQISICTDFDLHVFRYANQF